MFLNCADGVTGVSNTKCLRTCEVIDSAAFLNTLTSSDTVINQSGKERKRSSLSMSKVYTVVSLCQVVYEVFHLLLVSCKDIIYAVEGSHITGLRS